MGFSIVGTAIAVMILAPNMLMFILPPRNAPRGMKDAGVLFTALERIGQAGCFVLPVISKDWLDGRSVDAWFILAALCIAVYWRLWIRYALRREFELLFTPLGFVPIPMAVFPVLAFAFVAVWGRSVWLGMAAAALAAGHIANSWNGYNYVKQHGQTQ